MTMAVDDCCCCRFELAVASSLSSQTCFSLCFPSFLSLNDLGEIRDDGRGMMLHQAESIATEFIGSKAASQVNISSGTLKLTQDRLAQLPDSLSLNMFDEAASEILKVRKGKKKNRSVINQRKNEFNIHSAN